MIYFNNDYAEGCHPKVLEALIKTNMEQAPGYGTDDHCRSAADRIRSLCKDSTLAVHFLVGGTQANLTVIDAALRPHQGVVGADTAHINVHETGAVEATGHKVLWLPGQDGKITAEQIRACVLEHRTNESFEHTVQPKMVYLSNPTELGTLYSLHELEEISCACRELGLYLFVDGARLGYGLEAKGNDVTLPDLARLCDVFYIGGTKVGALFGEAVVISNPALKEDFRYLIKQHGGMLAKGRLLGVQFEALLEGGLYFEISRQADAKKSRSHVRRKRNKPDFSHPAGCGSRAAAKDLCIHRAVPGGRCAPRRAHLHQLGNRRRKCGPPLPGPGRASQSGINTTKGSHSPK